VNPVGAVLVPLYEPLKPKLVEPPAGTLPFHAAFVTVTAEPLWLYVALQPWVTVWLPGKANPSFHDVHAVEPVFVTVTFAVKPVPHEFAEYVTVHPPGGVVTVGRVRNATDVETGET
jgi:hypothetical protein